MPLKSSMKINCPKCNEPITLDKVFMQHYEDKVRKELEINFKKQEKKIKEDAILKAKKETLPKLKSLKQEVKEKEEIIKENRKQEKKIKEEAKLKAEKAIKTKLEDLKQENKEQNSIIEKNREQEKKIKEEAKLKAEKAIKTKLKDLNQEIKEQDKIIEEKREQELKLLREKRKLEEDKADFELTIERKLDEGRQEIYEKASKKAVEENELKFQEKVKTIEDLNKKLKELQRKAEQGSQQLQGEVLELELEKVLKETFIYDEIEPVAKGVKGADILQKVMSTNRKLCGTILIESKQAKWSNTWISKLKKDQREAKADIGIIATTILPEKMINFGFFEGVVIVHYKSIIQVVALLRNQIIEVARTKTSNEDKGEKMEAIYKYLTGVEFRQKVESIGEAFIHMMNDLHQEKRAITRIWSKREKQIEQAFHGVAGMYGGMQGIIGSSLPEIKSLSMPDLIEDQSEHKKKKK